MLIFFDPIGKEDIIFAVAAEFDTKPILEASSILIAGVEYVLQQCENAAYSNAGSRQLWLKYL